MAISLRKNSDGGTVGLDIDGRFLAAAQVTGGKLTNAASAELPSGVLADGEVTDRAALTAALKDFVATNKLPRRVQLGVSNQQIVVRVLDLPRIDDASERAAAISFQAAEAIAMPLDEAVIDHQVAGFFEGDGGAERMRVVVVAARRSMIDEYLGAARDAGLKVEGIDLDAFALVRMLADQARATFTPPPALEPEPDPEPIPVEEIAPPLDPTEEMAPTEPIALDPAPFEHTPLEPIEPEPEPAPSVEPELPAARVFCHLGGVSNLAVAIDSACYFSRTLSTRFDADAAGARLADEIRLSIDYYMAQPNALAVGDVILSGEGARDALLVADIEAQLGIPVAVAEPLGQIEALDLDDDEPYRYTVAAGLALGVAA
jgi:type IV pilus assembly protein PilM